MTASSFLTPPEGLERALAAARAHVDRPSGGVVFIGGPLAPAAARVAELVSKSWRRVPTVVVPAAGVLNERGEIEGTAAASGLLWSGGEVHPFTAEDDEGLGSAIAGAARGGGAAVLFATRGISPEGIAVAAASNPAVTVFGAGAAASPLAWGEGPPRAVAAAGLVVRRLAPLVRTASGCRLLGGLATIDRVEAGLVLEVGGEPALDLLAGSAPASTAKPGIQAPHPVVFAALAEAGEGDDRHLIRPVRGVDPDRKGVFIGPEARKGMRLGFAVRDAAAARAGVDAMARDIARDATGSAPSFALFLTCAGRGRGLYGAPDVETRILRQRLPDLPFAGMHSAFEITPWSDGTARVAFYTAVLAMFRAPS